MDIAELDRECLPVADYHKVPEEMRGEIESSEELKGQRFLYTKRTGRVFQVMWVGHYGMNCKELVVAYMNMAPTDDYPAFTRWVLEFDKIQKYFYIIKS